MSISFSHDVATMSNGKIRVRPYTYTRPILPLPSTSGTPGSKPTDRHHIHPPRNPHLVDRIYHDSLIVDVVNDRIMDLSSRTTTTVIEEDENR
jgi:hypothetical protein